MDLGSSYGLIFEDDYKIMNTVERSSLAGKSEAKEGRKQSNVDKNQTNYDVFFDRMTDE